MDPDLVDVVQELMAHPHLQNDPTQLDVEPGVDFRIVLIKDQVAQLEAALQLHEQQDGGPMTASQLNKVQMHLSSLTTLLSLLKSLIDRETIMGEAHPDAEIDPERLCTYLDLFHRLSAILEHFGNLHQSQLERWSSMTALPDDIDDPLLAPLTNQHNILNNNNFTDENVESDLDLPQRRHSLDRFMEDHGQLEGFPFHKYQQLPECKHSQKEEKYADGAKVPGPHEEPDLDVEDMECPICYGDFVEPEDKERIGGWGEIHRLCRCHHTYCQECIFTYVRTAIMDGDVEKIFCPDQNCGEEIPAEELEWICGEELFGKYQKFLHLKQLRKDPNTRWCPTVGCENGVCYKPEEGRKVLCLNCDNHFCGECSLPWHEGSCKSAVKKDKKKRGKERRGEKWVKKNSKPCPKCGIAIVKQSGCNHMSCNNCGYQFCWVCMEEFKSYAHYSSGKCKGKMFYASRAKRIAIYTGVGAAIGVAAILILPFALIGLPFYVAYNVIRN
mmetsp:Transcript_29801/g.46109  ORF Transcript_29801/g.46109 Transcript_29801/m.46109 type:complete len:499 (-) Transcript_29801:124-1620(-)|eukprot:CAMPEP_0201523542 /NCGR_PEP_ID=MMETSP0161_2-20130828/20242_1 /ASSEMBLY_ACC=CAM_ASM_000251 /TAXON_ID=180227 /ORGANISM="Neoparamoeba aestuarina, Strain SoJaBio B1-5/56/2" /LENGTH=498 /DNA_ID=CAMNT_0047922697 /DNA_START=365 /DNA_END=1861 /DNA_ORIENTATION=-